jgi:glyoxylase-like metal-dependent hydrolase (beta-lactamase superfamily II)
MTLVNRREVLGSLVAASVTQLTPSLGLASTPTSHTFQLGEFEITIFSDGHLTIPTRFLARNVSEAEIKAWLGQTADVVTPASNVTLVRTATDVMLIDVGAGPHFMPTAGKLSANMEAASIDREAITKVVFTHAHPDHLWGTCDDFDELMFPNASYFIPAAEWTFWMADDVVSRLPEDRQNFAPGAQRNLRRIRGKLATIKPGDDIATGIRTIDTSGHTPGHISIEIASGNDALIVLADALTHATISFAHPEWKPAGDHYDPERAAATRMALLDRLASDRTRIIGYHLPFPGLGQVERSGRAYRFVPSA